jgi:hypothetical protein
MIRRTVVFVAIFILLVITIANGADATYAATFPDWINGAATNLNLGWAFRVNAPIKITALGLCDVDMDGYGGGLWLWDEQDQSLLGVYWITNENSTLEGPVHGIGSKWQKLCQFRYLYLETPIELYPGQVYALTGFPDNNLISKWHLPNIPDEITFIEGRRYIAPHYPIYHSFEGYFGPNFKFESITQTVNIDIKPSSCPNPLNVNDKGVLPVAILGSEDFDVFNIDPASIRLEGVAPVRSSYEDVTTPMPIDAEICDCTTEGPDGYLDLTLKFKVQEIVAALVEVNDGEELELTLTGVLHDGTPIEGKDCILIISKGKPE